MPLTLLERDILGSCQTGDGLGAAHTLLCIEVAEAFEAVGVVLPGGEALTGQLLLAADAQETLTVPGFVLVGHSTCCYCLLTSTALVGKLLLEAGHTEVAVIFWDEGLGSYWLLAAVAQEAGFMPAVPLVFHFTGSWHDGFLAAGALGRIIVGVAFSAEQQIILSRKGLFHQRAAALRTFETLLMPVAILVGHVLAVTANSQRATLTAVSKQVLIALSAVLRVLFHYVLLPQQGVLAVMAVETLHDGHCCLVFLARLICGEVGLQRANSPGTAMGQAHFVHYKNVGIL